MQFEIDETKYMPPSTAEVLCREVLGIPIPSNIRDELNPLLAVMGKPKKPSKGNPRTEVVVLVQFGHFRDTAVRLNGNSRMPANKEKVMADTIKNLSAEINRVQDESDNRARALASALEFIERLQCTK
jgi:hypothetical protein